MDLLARLGLTDQEQRPRVGVSACLLGDNVRYNGEHKRHDTVADELARHLDLRRYCPEVGIGLPVPRPPVQVVRLAHGHRVRGVEAPDNDYTDALRAYADQAPAELHGFILKARSPSCGLESTPLFDPQDREIGVTSGAFAQRLRERMPLLPLCDEEALEDPAGRDEFVLRVFLFRHCRGEGAGRATGLLEQLPGALAQRLTPWLNRLAHT